jgi:hypothetical protein
MPAAAVRATGQECTGARSNMSRPRVPRSRGKQQEHLPVIENVSRVLSPYLNGKENKAGRGTRT